ncbi:type I methionyl aminopeptidase [Paenarthrobacter nitroguajacolicus]|uniref:type I methionyl aminopeptidase n=1 Tax=Paenarthrobacter nitroguajacolicus TaxID=211146 RepID=UPI00285726B5|nr:type I methionyl aminopeptidase [Paenarthrobacter nitroguajacolicus]MDR6637189.1 methionyl aminopeptidase [Paenarthrobacter nitroguajacolicus]
MIEILTPTELLRAKDSGALVANILYTLRDRCTVGTNLLDINQWAKEMILEAGAQSCYVDYAPSFGRGPFGHYICTGVNDAVLHGKPHDYALADGDLLTLDLAVSLRGIAADSAISFIVGDSKPAESVAMIEVTERALRAGIAAARPGARIGDLSYAIGSVLTDAGYPVNVEFGGHGIGSTMHQDPHVPNMGRPGRGYKLRPGLLLALEPWVMADTAQLVTDADGWTLRSVTGCRTAHSEHTIAITSNGAEILTLPTLGN